MDKINPVTDGREPSFTAMWHAWLRNRHASVHSLPIFSDSRSVQLVPAQTVERIVSVMNAFSPETGDAIVLMAVVRHRLLADQLPRMHARGVRQLVILGAGLDTTTFALPAWADHWRVFEVDHPATQKWKRKQITNLGWHEPTNLVFTPCDFERQCLLTALDAAGLNRQLPVLVSLFGVIVYLTADAAKTTLRELATFPPGSEVYISYCPPADGTDPIAQETFEKSSPIVDDTGERFVGYYRESQMESLLRAAGFREAKHYSIAELNTRYFAGRADGLRLSAIEQLVTGVC
jgi:methyltransferase (TIGR00027 family)